MPVARSELEPTPEPVTWSQTFRHPNGELFHRLWVDGNLFFVEYVADVWGAIEPMQARHSLDDAFMRGVMMAELRRGMQSRLGVELEIVDAPTAGRTSVLGRPGPPPDEAPCSCSATSSRPPPDSPSSSASAPPTPARTVRS